MERTDRLIFHSRQYFMRGLVLKWTTTLQFSSPLFSDAFFFIRPIQRRVGPRLFPDGQ